MDNRLLEHLLQVKQRAPMFFGPEPRVADLYNFLQGYRLACPGTPTVRDYLTELKAHILKTKNVHLGSRVAGPEDISFEEALDQLIRLVGL